MPNTPRVTQNEIDLTFAPATPATGITTFIGEAKRGPINKPSTIFTSWEAYRRVHGGLIVGNMFPLLIKRALERGSAVRVINIKHYSDIVTGTLAATNSAAASSSLVTLSGALGSDNTLTITVNTVANVQAFSVSTSNTLFLIAQKLKSMTAVVEDAIVLSSTAIVIIPKAGVALTTTSGVTGTAAPSATVVTEATFEDGANNTLFTFAPKYPGAAYNNLKVMVLAASNGSADSFDVRVELIDEGISELYTNLKIVGKPTVLESNYLNKINEESNLVKVTYSDLSAIVASQINPRKFAVRFQSGTDGGAVVDTDYIGSSSSKTGFYAADPYSDMSQVCVPDKSSVAILQAGAAYADSRRDLQFFGWLGDATTESAVATLRDNTLIDSKYTALFAGKITVVDPDSKNRGTLDISPMGDICGIADFNDSKFKPHYAFSGTNRGVIYNAMAVVNNFGTNGNYVNLNMLGNRQVNLVVNENNKIFLKSSFSAQKDLSDYSWNSITRMVINLKKTLGPFLASFLEEPNDIPTWKRMYLQGYPTLETLRTERGISDYSWQGDQFATSLDNLQTNLINEVDQGKYRLRIFMKAIKPINEIVLDIILSPSGVSFEDNIELLTNQF